MQTLESYLPTPVRLRRKGGVVIQDCDIYVGRAQHQGGWHLDSSIWANPYKVAKDGALDEVCTKYYWYVRGRPDLMTQLPELYGKRLGCWCDIVEQHRPLLDRLNRPQCHAEVLMRLAHDQLSRVG